MISNSNRYEAEQKVFNVPSKRQDLQPAEMGLTNKKAKVLIEQGNKKASLSLSDSSLNNEENLAINRLETLFSPFLNRSRDSIENLALAIEDSIDKTYARSFKGPSGGREKRTPRPLTIAPRSFGGGNAVGSGGDDDFPPSPPPKKGKRKKVTITHLPSTIITSKREKIINFTDNLNKKSDYLHKFIRDMQSHIVNCKHRRVIQEKQYQELLDNLNAAAGQFQSFVSNMQRDLKSAVNVNYRAVTSQLEDSVKGITTDLKALCTETGFSSLIKGIDFFMGDQWEKGCSKENIKRVHFFDHYFIPIGFKVVDSEYQGDCTTFLNDKGGKLVIDKSVELATDEILLSPHRFSSAHSLYETHHGAELCIPYLDREFNEKVLVVKGFFPIDHLNVTTLSGEMKEKKDKVLDELRFSSMNKAFADSYMKQCSSRDLLLLSAKEIARKIESGWQDLQLFRRKNMFALIDEFKGSSIDKQFHMLKLNLMDQDVSAGFILWTMVDTFSSDVKEEVKRNLHLSLQKKVEQTENELKNLEGEMKSRMPEKVDYKSQILLSNMSDQAKEKALEKLNGIKGQGSDAEKNESWLRKILKIPFGKYTSTIIGSGASRGEKQEYIKSVENRLNQAVYGHDDAKKQILGLVAQWTKKGEADGAIIGIKGPPGNGKTTLAKEGIAKALDRPFGFLPLGGVTDSSFLTGHNFTYVGSQPGRLAEILMEAGTMNPLIYIDELDKVSQTEHGKEIIGVLIHLFDSSQNKEIRDKYFNGVDLDFSRAIIVCSYNDPSLIDPILLDRMDKINTGPLVPNQKLEVAKGYLLPQILKDVGFNPGDIKFSDDLIKHIINEFTYEAGVRRLKQHLFSIVREINLKLMMEDKLNLPLEVTKELVAECIKSPCIKIKKITDKPHVGYVNGLYATSAGIGGLTIIQALKSYSENRLTLELTGSQGEVMQESMKISKTVAWNILPQEVRDRIQKETPFGLHIHAPEGATPKDGPSAGGAITSAIISQLTGVPIRNDVAMTGEITGAGEITQIGGLYSKLKGAKSAGVRLACIPKDNEEDLIKAIEKDPELVDASFKVITVDNIYDLLSHVLVENDLKFEQL